MKRGQLFVAVLVGLVVFTLPVLAHVPEFAGDNTSPETAYHVDDAAKSWSFYDTLEPGQVRYYELHLDAGDRLRVSLFTPGAGEFAPSLVLMREGGERTDQVPDSVEVPDGMGSEVLVGVKPATAEFEPFTPSAYYHTVDVDRVVAEDGHYLLAIYEPNGLTGRVGVAIGYEERFSPVEYVTVPLDLVGVHLWEGKHPLVVAAPYLAAFATGLAYVRRRVSGRSWSWRRSALALAAVLFLGTAASTLLNLVTAGVKSGLVPGMALTSLFVVVPALLGAWLLRFSASSGVAFTSNSRAKLAAAGAAGFLTWAGVLVGPALVLLVALVPSKPSGESSR